MKTDYFYQLIEDQGIIQFTQTDNKDYQFGFAIEDQARGLLVALELEDQHLIDLFLSLILRSIDPLGVKMLWNEKGDYLERVDCYKEASAECLWALGIYQSKFNDPGLNSYIQHLINGLKDSHFLRVWAYSLLGLTALQDKENTDFFGQKIVANFNIFSSQDWQWPEETMTYGNALIPWSLLLSYQLTANKNYLDIGKKTLDFLLEHFKKNDLPIVVGNKGWWKQGFSVPLFDQQPIDISYLILACIDAYKILKDPFYLEKAKFYFSWFQGNNLLQTPMVEENGKCHDGLNQSGSNPNGGAESTICYLLADLTLSKFLQKSSRSDTAEFDFPRQIL